MKLSIKQRFFSVGIYLSLIIGIYYCFNTNLELIFDVNNKFNLIFIVSSLMLILGSYITEPYFTKPVDVTAKSIAIILILITIDKPDEFYGYKIILSISLLLLLLSIISMLLLGFPKLLKLQKTIVEIITSIGRPEIIFSSIYLLALFSYFKSNPVQFVTLFGFWLLLIFKKPVEKITILLTKLYHFIFHAKIFQEPIGQAIGCENPFLYKVEIDFEKYKNNEINKGQLVCLELNEYLYSIGLVINEKHLLNKKWITVYLLKDNDNKPLKINIKNKKFISDSNMIFSKSNQIFSFNLETLDDEQKTVIEKNILYKNKENFIGYISKDSNIKSIRFIVLIDNENEKHKKFGEGIILNTTIFEKEVLYQVIDGRTDEEKLEKHDIYGYTTGLAQKLGVYEIKTKELNTAKWLPEIYSPVFLLKTNEEKDSSDSSIGKLPETDFEILIKDYNSLITHNTAILGILGIGKSCLTFELIKKIVNNTDVKIICIDITNEYNKNLKNYVDVNLINYDDENVFNEINSKFEYIFTTSDKKQYPEKSGNMIEYHKVIKKDLCKFLFEKEDIPEDKKILSSKKIRVYNPDYHKASKGAKIGFNVITAPLTQAEKTRVISEEIFKILMKLPAPENQKAQVLLVFEEAHSLIPEWNSIANEGDKNAVNGTAKVILQGRKYGMGSLVVTQRTANISKSILNQCNTIFALRVFDDTGKQFLENYIGSDYANILPTLEERHAIAFGKALMLKQPVIIKLNHMDSIKII